MANDIPDGDLATVLTAVFERAAPDLFGGASPPVQLSLTSQEMTVLQGPREDRAGPRRTTGSETIPIDASSPLGPYEISVAPSPGVRIVRLKMNGAVAASLHDDEVAWDPVDGAPVFRLTPRPYRSLSGMTGVQIIYPITTSTATIGALVDSVVDLSGPIATLPSARALAMAVLSLESELLLSHLVVTTTAGDYSTLERARTVDLTSITTTGGGDRGVVHVNVRLNVDVEVGRALHADEGSPIERIFSPGSRSTLPIDIEPNVDA